MKTRIKIRIKTLDSRDAAEAAMNSLALTINSQRTIIAERDAALLAITDDYAPELASHDQAIKILTEQLHAWAAANPDQFPKDRKSLAMASGTLGFRTGTPKLALLSRAFTWDKVLGLLRAVAPWRNYIRIKEEVDKESLLGAHSTAADKSTFADDLHRFGLRITQEESFYVEPALTALETRQTTDAS